MKIPESHRRRFFFHFTHIENLDSILKNGLLSTNKKNSAGINHKNVASKSIQNRRSNMDVTCFPRGKVHDYVPFYFTTINPMLLSVINSKNIDQPFIIFLAVSIDKIKEDDVVFTDASANTDPPPNFYKDPLSLDKLDWQAIDSRKWSTKDNDELHRRMAEVLVHKEVPLDWIDRIIVWNEGFRDEVKDIYTRNKIPLPKLQFQPLNRKYFYFTKFSMGNDRKGETLVTGPYFLKHHFLKIMKNIHENRQHRVAFKFKNLSETLNEIEKDFCAIEELKGIHKLETENDVHSENVSDHTIDVVGKLNDIEYYKELSQKDKDLVKLSAYLHDIGKGPKSKWSSGKQPSYPDHPVDSLKMVERILTEDIEDLNENDIRKICLLVGYHDLIGDIACGKRDLEQLIDLVENELELNMLIAISIADVSAISIFEWSFKLRHQLPKIIKEVQSKWT